MQGAAYYINLTSIGKQSHAPGTAAAHYRYIARKAAVIAEGGSLFPEGYGEAQKYLTEREGRIRKNGVLAHKIIVNLPFDLSQNQREALVKDLCWELAKDRAPIRWFMHGDTKAPHAHILFVDEDHETKKRHMGLSTRGLFHIRKVWESLTNKHLIAAQSQARVSRWGKESQHHKELNMEAKRGPTVKAYDTILTAEAELTALRHNVLQAKQVKREYEHVLEAVKNNEAAIESSQKALALAMRSNDTAIQELDRHKMWLLVEPVLAKLGLYHRRLQQARAARSQANAAAIRVKTLQQIVDDNTAFMARKHIYLRMLQREIEQYQAKLSTYGTPQDIKALEAELKAVIQHNIGQIQPDKLTLEQKQKVAQISMQI